MRISEKKEKNSLPLKIDGGKTYLLPGNRKEEEYLKYAAHLLSGDLSKAVYRLDVGYLFLKRTNDVITAEPRAITDDGEAKFEIDSFFEGRAAEVFDDSEVAEIRKSLLSDKRVVLAAVVVTIAIAFYAFFKITEPKRYMAVNRNKPAAPTVLSDAEKTELMVIGSRMISEKITEIISSVSPDIHTRIDAMTVQRVENPQTVSYSINTNEEYLYPEIGAVSRTRGVWGKPFSESISLERKDIKPVESEDFSTCSLRMLNDGFYVEKRGDLCVDFTYEGNAAKTVDIYNSLMRCNMVLNSLNVSAGKGKLDVTLCK